jgi:hypothetical protein
MEAWWNALSSTEKLLWLIATFSTVLFGLQIVSTFFGMGDSDMDMDADFDMDAGGDFDAGAHGDADMSHGHGDADAVHDADAGHWIAGYFTVRNFVAFFLGLSWGSLAFISSGLPNALAIFFGMGIGVFFVIVVMFLMKALSNLHSEGTISLRSAVGTEADVSILIPGNNQGSGKITLTVQGRLMEIEAITEGEELRRSDRVRVVNVSQHQLVVEKVQ